MESGIATANSCGMKVGRSPRDRRFSRRDFCAGMFATAAVAGARPLSGANLDTEMDPDLAVFISDLHVNGLAKNGGHQEACLRKAVPQILALRPRPAYVVCLGDIAFLWGMSEDYRHAKAVLQPLYDAGMKVALGMGNHDRRAGGRRLGRVDVAAGGTALVYTALPSGTMVVFR